MKGDNGRKNEILKMRSNFSRDTLNSFIMSLGKDMKHTLFYSQSYRHVSRQIFSDLDKGNELIATPYLL